MNEPTWFQRLNEALKRRYGIQGDGPVTTFASDAFPTVQVDDDHLSAELHYLAQSTLSMHGEAVGALALNYSQVCLENPTGSGALVVVESIQASAGALTRMQVRIAGAVAVAPTYATAPVARDLRKWTAVGSWQTGSAKLGSLQAAAAVGAIGWTVLVQQEVPYVLPCTPIILKPGSMLIVGPAEVNIGVTASMAWRERALNAWEESA